MFFCRSGVTIRNHADLRGLKIRVGQISPTYQEVANLGALPQLMPLTMVGDALRERVIDCVAIEELRHPGSLPGKPLDKQVLNAEFALPHEGRALTPEARAELDSLVGKLGTIKLQTVIVVATVAGSNAKAADQTRANDIASVVKNYLVSKGVSANSIYAEGKTSEPVPGKASVRVDLQAIGTGR